MLLSKHDNYVMKISELKNDLKSLSGLVVNIKDEMNKRDVEKGFDDCMFSRDSRDSNDSSDKLQSSLKANVEQLEKLVCEKSRHLEDIINQIQEAERKTAQSGNVDDICRQLEISNLENETLRNDIARYKVQQQQTNVDLISVKNELTEFQQKYKELEKENSQIKSLLSMEATYRIESTYRYKKVTEKYEEQAQALRNANYQCTYIQGRLQNLMGVLEECQMERDLLREEVIALKQKEDQLCSDCLCSRKDLQESQKCIERLEQTLAKKTEEDKEALQKMKLSCNESVSKLNYLMSENARLRAELGQQDCLIEQNEKVLESFRKWKEQQAHTDNQMQQNLKEYEKQIQKLLKDKNALLKEYKLLRQAYCKLKENSECTKANMQRQFHLYDYSDDTSDSDYAECQAAQLAHRLQHRQKYL
ncbi:putative leucine-rich repeat-containing protein DDB_G0290503 isoform X2 [Teleopsis dalmanni]|nr:putative leucine-rich repeat-containing protein DDB_G0290503 isoform X2 [Teleopsis dalmanni]